MIFSLLIVSNVHDTQLRMSGNSPNSSPLLISRTEGLSSFSPAIPATGKWVRRQPQLEKPSKQYGELTLDLLLAPPLSS